MTHQKLNELCRQAEDRKLALRENKGAEYTRGDLDPLSNFKRVAAGLDSTPLAVWWVYFHKHIDALASFIKTGREASDEGIEGRIDDLQVYLDLVRGLIHEHKAGKFDTILQENQQAYIVESLRVINTQMSKDGQGLTQGQFDTIKQALLSGSSGPKVPA